MLDANLDDLRRFAREYFGWASLRPGLEEAMSALAGGRDVLAVMPTGYGKSSIYQVVGSATSTLTVVVSPLIALQEDQVRALVESRSPATAVAINSSKRVEARSEAWDELEASGPRFVFLSPEQLADPAARGRLADLGVGLFVVDEAHCVSSWGHDFRPDYLFLGEVIAQFGHPPVLALTATGAPPVRSEIIDRLGMSDPLLAASGFDRPNLHLRVVRHESDQEKHAAVIDSVVALSGQGLVYTATRRDAERYAEELNARSRSAAAYHAGLSAKVRDAAYEDFIRGETDVVVATSAFGMGIDKPDIRFVVHASVTDSLDTYYQEIGRSGRDGEPAEAILHYRPEDFALTNFFSGGLPDAHQLARVFDAMSQNPGATRAEVARILDLSARQVGRLIGLLEDARVVSAEDGGPAGDAPNGARAAELAVERAEARKRIEQSRVQMMQEFAETLGCRRQFLLGYFGEQFEHPCGHCDTCETGTATRMDEEPVREGRPFPPDARVRHSLWGSGVVMSAETDRLTVFFDEEGYKTLSLAAAQADGLLTLETSMSSACLEDQPS